MVSSIDKLDDELCIRLDKGMGTNYLKMFDMRFPLGRNKRKSLRTEKSQKRNTITGDITYPESVAFNSRKELTI